MGSTRQKCLCRVPGPGGTRQNLFSENKKNYRVPKDDTRQSFFLKKIKTNFAECLMAGTRQNLMVGGRRHGPAKFCQAPGFAECQALGKVQICRVPDFAECLALGKVCFAECKILPSATLGKILLCRVPRYFALGKVSGTRQITVFQ